MTFNNKYIFILILLITISCKGQNDKKENTMEEAEISILKIALENNHYKPEKDFNDKIFEFLGISANDLSDKGYDDIKLNNEYIDYQISKQGGYIKIGQDILPDLDSVKEKIIVKKEKYPYVEDVSNLNKILFLDDTSSVASVIHKNKDLATDLVVLFDYEKNKLLTSIALRNIESLDNQPKYFNWCILFYNNRRKNNIIRQELLLKLHKTNTDIISNLITYIVKNKSPVSQKATDECLAFLINLKLKEANTGDWNNNEGFGLLSYCYETDKDLVNRFGKVAFYGYPLIKSATEAYSAFNTDTQKDYIIDDPDGYTNLRKEKNAQSEVLQKIKSGESVEVLNNSGDWWQVKTKEGKTGYVHKSRITNRAEKAK